MPKAEPIRTGTWGTLSFFLPLALTSAMTMLSHSLISAGLARTVDPAASLAAYSVALTAEDLFESPIVQTRQMTLALLKGPRSLAVISRVALAALLVSMTLGLVVAATPVGSFAFTRLMGVPNDLLQATLGNFLVVMLLPFLAGARSFCHGIVIKYRQTAVMTAAMVGRVGLMAGFIYSCLHWGWFKGGYIGSTALIVGVSVELIAAVVASKRLLRQHHHDGEDQTLTYRSAWRFYYPLAIAAVLASTAKPWITAGIARGSDAVTALAAYSVAWSVGSILINPMQNIHQVTLVIGQEPAGDIHVRRFAAVVGCFSSGLLLILSFSSLGRFIFSSWVGIPDTLMELTLHNLRVMALLPMLLSAVEYLTGKMLAHSMTQIISAAKVGNLLATMATVVLLADRSKVIGPLSLVIGAAVELFALSWGWFCWRRARRACAF